MSAQPESNNSSSSKVYSKAALFELAAQNPTNTYICIHENVYDVTDFLDEHPGGEEALKEHQINNDTFRDATESFEDVGHSMDARDLMQKYQIGVLENKKPVTAKRESKIDAARSSGGSSWTWMILPALAAIGLAFVYQYISHRQQ